MYMIETIPWVEKYRPTRFKNIVLDSLNKKLLHNIINNTEFPNLLLYGPPGTGKTTTIINIIKEYQEKQEGKSKFHLIQHLNASDNRGIEIIRNQIYNFVNSKPLFDDGLKFVILDEVDYMTKNAQQALKYLLQNYNKGICFCLICNYISKIDISLQNEFIRLRFNQLPEKDIQKFIMNVAKKEKIKLNINFVKMLQSHYNSDIRSMINYIQSNHDIIQCDKNNIYILEKSTLKKIHERFKTDTVETNKLLVYDVLEKYKISVFVFIKKYFNYVVTNNLLKDYHINEFLSFVENVIHNMSDIPHDIYIKYICLNIKKYFKK
jgi:DNA polymerase III delta prime subunit